MKTPELLKEMVREKYGAIAKQSTSCGCCGCGSSQDNSGEALYSVFSENYEQLQGYHADADLQLGCGLPTEYAQIKSGDTVVDLGSGAGNDCFVARSLTGSTGKVIGIDMTPAMIDKARKNAKKLNFDNVVFELGDLENIPLPTHTADVVISNCVFNLVPDKERAFAETFRILKSGGHFSISDVVIEGELPESLLGAAEMYAGCVAGASPRSTYLEFITKTGFVHVSVQRERVIDIPDDILLQFASAEELQTLRKNGAGVYSLTVFGQKP